MIHSVFADHWKVDARLHGAEMKARHRKVVCRFTSHLSGKKLRDIFRSMSSNQETMLFFSFGGIRLWQLNSNQIAISQDQATE